MVVLCMAWRAAVWVNEIFDCSDAATIKFYVVRPDMVGFEERVRERGSGGGREGGAGEGGREGDGERIREEEDGAGMTHSYVMQQHVHTHRA